MTKARQATRPRRSSIRSAVAAAVPPDSDADQLKQGRMALAQIRAQGITTFMDAAAGPAHVRVFKALRDSGELTARVNLAMNADPAVANADPARTVADAIAQSQGVDEYEYGATPEPGVYARVIKVFVDGVVNAPADTGAMLDPYFTNVGTATEPKWVPGTNRGQLFFSTDSLKTLMRIAAAREEPIPVYAEMSAINPVILLPHILEENAEALAAGYASSMAMGAGQFCTNPGLVLALESPALQHFLTAAAAAVTETAAAVMLTPAIHRAYEEGIAALASVPQVDVLARGKSSSGPHQCEAALFTAPADAFDPHGEVAREVFGASSVLVRCRDEAALLKIIAQLEGQLTASVHFSKADEPLAARLLPSLERKVGRLIANGWPTGVEVSHAMVHGGPFPATSDGRSSSVGTLAIDRFLRPVCYQDFPDSLRPSVLRDAALDGTAHRFDGQTVA